MSAGGTELHRFGIDPDSPPDQRQWEGVCRFLKALLNNPNLQIGDANSQVVFPDPIPAGKSQTTAAAAAAPCPFGEIITVDGDKYIRGGVLYGGDDNWNVADYLINLAADSDNLIWLEVGITANTEDSVLMPNLESSTEPTWGSGAVAGGYPSNTAPNITTGVGTRIVPIGQLTVVDGVATFDPVGCGNITLGFCPPNNLSITRG